MIRAEENPNDGFFTSDDSFHDMVGYTLGDPIVIGPFTAFATSAATLELFLGVSSSTDLTFGEGFTRGSSQFGSTMSLPTSGPVFDLPAGFSVNSASANIVNNEWQGTPVGLAIPVPGTVGLLLGGVGAFVMRRGRG